MSTKNVESLVNRTTTQGSGAVQTAGRVESSVGDHTGVYPPPGLENAPATNKGGKLLNTFGAAIPDDTIQGNETEYTQVYEYTTPGGHSIEYNDTSGSERIMLRHANGTGINIGPDGSIIVSSKRRVDVVNENYNLSVTGDGNLSFQGNLSLSVTGDLNLDVGGEFNVTSQKKTETVNGPSVSKVYGDKMSTVNGNESNLVTGGGVVQYFNGLNTIVKGDVRYAVQGNMLVASSGVLTMTAEQEIVLTTPEANIAATNLSIFGDTGTIGGENIIAYVKNIYGVSGDFSARVRAPLFEGDLTGTANQAITADVTNSQNYSDPDTHPGSAGNTGSAQGYTIDDTALDTTATALPTANLLSDYQTKGSKGVKKVTIDPDNVIKNNLDLTVKTGGVSERQLSAAQVRSKMRDPAHRSNAEFIALMQSQGKLSPEYAKTTPPNVSTIIDTSSIVIQGQTPMGSPSSVLTSKRIKAV
jgi:hypothetical protein